ncbi:MAG: ribbon-helix-helix domain-containing protein [Peptostreptococcaceae bacterium]|nr:ribbon-helix-helix domain-containing protein [Peptostreptococcaceae bacterium]
MNDLVNRERIGTSLPIQLVKDLKEYSKKSMIPVSRIIEQAIKEYLDSK